jgi:hypothetical protein
LNPVEERIWVTSDNFAELLRSFAGRLGLEDSSRSWLRQLAGLVHRPFVSPYDRIMQRLHHVMKRDEVYQENARKHFWHFAPRSAWLLFSDALAHADLRGRYLIDYSFFVGTDGLVLPHESPQSLLQALTSGKRQAA